MFLYPAVKITGIYIKVIFGCKKIFNIKTQNNDDEPLIYYYKEFPPINKSLLIRQKNTTNHQSSTESCMSRIKIKFIYKKDYENMY